MATREAWNEFDDLCLHVLVLEDRACACSRATLKHLVEVWRLVHVLSLRGHLPTPGTAYGLYMAHYLNHVRAIYEAIFAAVSTKRLTVNFSENGTLTLAPSVPPRWGEMLDIAMAQGDVAAAEDVLFASLRAHVEDYVAVPLDRFAQWAESEGIAGAGEVETLLVASEARQQALEDIFDERVVRQAHLMKLDSRMGKKLSSSERKSFVRLRLASPRKDELCRRWNAILLRSLANGPWDERDSRLSAANADKPQPRQRHQEMQVLAALKKLNFNPTRLPTHRLGARNGPKAQCRKYLRELYGNAAWSDSVFRKAWERLRAGGEIAEGGPSKRL